MGKKLPPLSDRKGKLEWLFPIRTWLRFQDDALFSPLPLLSPPPPFFLLAMLECWEKAREMECKRIVGVGQWDCCCNCADVTDFLKKRVCVGGSVVKQAVGVYVCPLPALLQCHAFLPLPRSSPPSLGISNESSG